MRELKVTFHKNALYNKNRIPLILPKKSRVPTFSCFLSLLQRNMDPQEEPKEKKNEEKGQEDKKEKEEDAPAPKFMTRKRGRNRGGNRANKKARLQEEEGEEEAAPTINVVPTNLRLKNNPMMVSSSGKKEEKKVQGFSYESDRKSAPSGPGDQGATMQFELETEEEKEKARQKGKGGGDKEEDTKPVMTFLGKGAPKDESHLPKSMRTGPVRVMNSNVRSMARFFLFFFFFLFFSFLFSFFFFLFLFFSFLFLFFFFSFSFLFFSFLFFSFLFFSFLFSFPHFYLFLPPPPSSDLITNQISVKITKKQAFVDMVITVFTSMIEETTRVVGN